MTNPSPRPALRKAADAEVHPAAPQPARSPRAREDGVVVARVPDARPAHAVGDVTVAPAVPAPLKPAKKRHADGDRPARPTKRKFSGSTSDHLRVPEVAEAGGSAQRSALDALFDGDPAPAPAPTSRAPKPKTSTDASQAPTDKPRKAKASTGTVDLMSGKPVDLGARVPKALRKAARDQAKRLGLDVDTVVTDLLHAWLTGPR